MRDFLAKSKFSPRFANSGSGIDDMVLCDVRTVTLIAPAFMPAAVCRSHDNVQIIASAAPADAIVFGDSDLHMLRAYQGLLSFHDHGYRNHHAAATVLENARTWRDRRHAGIVPHLVTSWVISEGEPMVRHRATVGEIT